MHCWLECLWVFRGHLLCQGFEVGLLCLQGYHLLAVALFAPALVLEQELLQISLAIATALLGLLEVVRISRFPLLGMLLHILGVS